MKKWNTPVIAELDINMTENGGRSRFDEGWSTYDTCLGTAHVYSYYGDPQHNDDGGKKGGDASDNGDVTNLTSGPNRCGF